VLTPKSIIEQLMGAKEVRSEFFSHCINSQNPYSGASQSNIDVGYPHTHLNSEFFRQILKSYSVEWIVEVGSMVGGSAIRMCEVAKSVGREIFVTCIDPFTGDVNMWEQEPYLEDWKYLNLENGIPTIGKRFLSNVFHSGHSESILPLNTTSSVGLKFLMRLISYGRISQLPNAIYLDSAHEKDETYLELKLCFELLPIGGVLFGDDWDWDAVKTDVIRFANDMNQEGRIGVVEGSLLDLEHERFAGAVYLFGDHWLMIKS
jgi:hypothetical protein